MSKRPRTLDSFLGAPATKCLKQENERKPIATTEEKTEGTSSTQHSNHLTYPHSLPHLPKDIISRLNFAPADGGRIINPQPDLDLLYFKPYIPKEVQRPLFEFLRRELFFYRVQYIVKRGPTERLINTPRYTTVFGLDETSLFTPDGSIIDTKTGKPFPLKEAYTCKPRPIPECLDLLRRLTEHSTGCKFNFALVNYYANGNDSISYHSDDERFLGPEPAIASFTLGARRDFLLRHKKTPAAHPSETKPIKLPLGSGDMVLMRGKTQSFWEHSIPKRKGGEAEKGRINITFRRALTRGGTANYYRYNVGDGGVFRWDGVGREMKAWEVEKE